MIDGAQLLCGVPAHPGLTRRNQMIGILHGVENLHYGRLKPCKRRVRAPSATLLRNALRPAEMGRSASSVPGPLCR